MREIRRSGSEVGAAQADALSMHPCRCEGDDAVEGVIHYCATTLRISVL